MPERTIRTRVGVSKTGKYSWDCTIEINSDAGELWDETAEEAEGIVKDLED